MHEGREVLATLLRHEAKSNTYKFALIRALNDLALDHPWLPEGDVVVPLRRVAERWLVSYWPFVGEREIQQGARSRRDGVLRQDISFRAALTQVRLAWETLPYARSHPADGALLLAEYQAGRGRLSPELRTLTQQALVAIMQAVKQPVKFAGVRGVHEMFGPPAPVATLSGVPLPGAQPGELAFIVPVTLWQALQQLSLWVEALCLQQWSLFIERVDQTPRVTRGEAFMLLTATPDARVPLTWERNQVRLLLLEGTPLTCPWTGHVLDADAFDLDHLIPVSVHPINELWNLVPSDPRHNQHVKRARIPGEERLRRALPILTQTYAAYTAAPGMANSFQQDVRQRFGSVLPAPQLAQEVIRISDAVPQARNVPRY